MRLRELRLAGNAELQKPKVSDAKADYEQKKRENAERRAMEKKIERARMRITEIEKKLEELDRELFTTAQADYVRASEIDKEKSELEEELLSLYELVM
jgi:hypothetical protein